MRKVMMILFGVLAVGAVSVVASASALAADPACVKDETFETFRVCVELLVTPFELELLEEATFSVLQEQEEPHVLKIEFAAAAEIECATGTGSTGAFEELIMNAKLTFTECTVVTPEHCKLANSTIATVPIDGTLSLATELEPARNGEPELEGLRLDLLFAPESGTEFASFTIESTGGTCIDAQVGGKVKGKQLCYFLEMGQNIEVDELEHLFECPPEGSELEFAGNVATLHDEWSVLMITPAEDDSWSIIQGL